MAEQAESSNKLAHRETNLLKQYKINRKEMHYNGRSQNICRTRRHMVPGLIQQKRKQHKRTT